MLSCRDVTRLISESMDRSLPLRKRIGVRVHFLICRFCARYERQLLQIREMARHLASMGEHPGEPYGETLSAGARERIMKSLQTPGESSTR